MKPSTLAFISILICSIFSVSYSQEIINASPVIATYGTIETDAFTASCKNNEGEVLRALSVPDEGGNNNLRDIRIQKFGVSATLEWTRNLGALNADDEVITCEWSQDSNSVYITGNTYGIFKVGSFNTSIEHDASSGDIFVSKWTTNGAVEWTHQIGDSYSQSVHDMVVDINAQMVLAATNNSHAWMTLHSSTNGLLLLSRNLPTTPLSYSSATSVSIDRTSNELYFAGNVYGNTTFGINPDNLDEPDSWVTTIVYPSTSTWQTNRQWQSERSGSDTINRILLDQPYLYLFGSSRTPAASATNYFIRKWLVTTESVSISYTHAPTTDSADQSSRCGNAALLTDNNDIIVFVEGRGDIEETVEAQTVSNDWDAAIVALDVDLSLLQTIRLESSGNITRPTGMWIDRLSRLNVVGYFDGQTWSLPSLAGTRAGGASDSFLMLFSLIGGAGAGTSDNSSNLDTGVDGSTSPLTIVGIIFLISSIVVVAAGASFFIVRTIRSRNIDDLDGAPNRLRQGFEFEETEQFRPSRAKPKKGKVVRRGSQKRRSSKSSAKARKKDATAGTTPTTGSINTPSVPNDDDNNDDDDESASTSTDKAYASVDENGTLVPPTMK